MIDFHSHSNFSYCADRDVNLFCYEKAIKENPLLEAVCITDHGMSIYFPEQVAWSWEFLKDDSVLDAHINSGNARLEKYLEQFSKYRNTGIHCGLEVEMAENGRLIYDPVYRKKFTPLIGSVHFLFTSKKYGFSDCEILNDWIYHTEKLLCSGIDILAHPFRWLCGQIFVNDSIVERIVNYAQREGVALELNGHNVTNSIYRADKTMLKVAAETGAKISFGVDAHEVKSIGDFSYHLKILEDTKLSLNDINILKLEEL